MRLPLRVARNTQRLIQAAMVAGLLATTQAVPAAEAGREALAAFDRDVQPLMQQFCFRCHGGRATEQDGPVRLDRLDPDFVAGPHAETWHEALDHLNRGEMPPEDEPQPSAAQRQKIVDWITTQLQRAAAARSDTGRHVVLRRLTRYEYNNTMRDLLGLDIDYSKDLPPEPTSPDGFKNNGAVLSISPLQIEYYLKTARAALAKVIVTGQRPEVFTHQATTSEAGKKKRVTNSNRLVTNEQFVVRLKEFPRAGDFRIRVRAWAEMPGGAADPRMQVSIGLRSDTISPEEAVGELDVNAAKNKAEVYDFVGRIEEFPLPGHNPKFPGLLLIVRNVHTQQDPKAKRPKKSRKGEEQFDSSKPAIIVESLEFEGPLLDSWPPATHTRIMFARDSADSDSDYARKVLARFMERAFRRPVNATEVEAVGRFFDKIRPTSPSLEEAMRESLARVLISPDFLYLIESAGAPGKRMPLSDFELASRLSYFLWSTMPDETLFALAQDGKLRQPQILEQQVRRMIADKRSWNFVQNYTDQWLNLSGMEPRVAVNPEFYPNFDNRLKGDMRGESQHFFAEILYNDLSYMNVIDSDFTMLNRRLAQHYEMPGPPGNKFERVAVKAEHRRGGLLAQGSMLLSNSTGEDSHPIKRAVWLLERLLDDPPAPPPPDVPELNKKEADLAGLSMRKQLEIHRTKEACNSCHRGIDPWGIPLENYDAIGRWRERMQGPAKEKNAKTAPVEAESVLPGGHEVNGVEGLKAYLLASEKARLARACVKKLLAYSLGRSVELGDRQAVEMLTKKFVEREYRLSDLIVEIVKSEPFQTK